MDLSPFMKKSAFVGLLCAATFCVLPCVGFLGFRFLNPSLEGQMRHAVEVGDVDSVVSLLHRGASVNTRCAVGSDINTQWARPIHIAAARGDVKVLRALLNYGADPDSRDSSGETPMMSIAGVQSVSAHFRCMDVLLDYGADLEAKRALDEATAYWIAAHCGNERVASYLISRGANQMVRTKVGKAP